MRDAGAVEVEDEDRVRPALVPADSSCSEAIPITSPTGDSCRPAVARSVGGSPAIASTPLWSLCSWVTSTRSAVDGADGGELESNGLVARRPDPADGRRALVEITPAGRATLDGTAATASAGS